MSGTRENSTSRHPDFNSFPMGVFPSRRSTVMGTLGMVSSSQPLASQAGVKILEQGGNAADAAVAVAAALAVTEPCSNGIGGDSFCLFWDEKKKQVRGINASGRSPAKMTLQVIHRDGISTKEGGIPHTHPHGVTVPGAAASWVDTVDKFGSGRLSLKQILQPAIRLAEDGYPVHEIVAQSWQRHEEIIQGASPNAGEMLLPNGRAPRAGQIMQMSNLAKTFKELADKGRDGFYKGRIAQEIVKVLKDKGGLMELEDLAHHAEEGSEEITPISYEYTSFSRIPGTGAITLHECPPNGQGLVALIALGILDSLEKSGRIPSLSTLDHNSAEYLHILITALRLGFADAHEFVTDSAHGGCRKVDSILSRDYLDKRASIFDPENCVPISAGNPMNSSDTVYFTCTDENGNACSFIQSNYVGFGSCIIPKGCGFTLQNRGCNFSLEKDHINCIAPRKRPYHTIIPAMATQKTPNGPKLFMSYGVMGGFMQPQGQIQVLMNILRGYTPQAALDAPRFCIGTGMPGEGDILSGVSLEEGIEKKVVEKLKEMGHQVEFVETWAERGQFGRGQIIMPINGQNRKHRIWAAGCDPRSDGQAIAQV